MKQLVALTAYLAFAPLAFAQVEAVTHGDASRGATLFPASLATADEATAPTYNPAALPHVGSAQIMYAHERGILRNQIVNGLYGAFSVLDTVGLGGSVEWVQGPTPSRKGRLSFGLGREWLSLGANASFYDGAGTGRLTSFDLGVLSRICRGFSAGFVVRNVNAPSNATVAFARNYSVGLGLRPFAEWLTLGVDWNVSEAGGPALSRMSYSLMARTYPGFNVWGGVSHGFGPGVPVSFQAGLTVDLPNVGAGYALSGTGTGLNHLAQVRVSADRYRAPVFRGTIAVIDLESLDAKSSGTVAQLLGVTETNRYLRLMRLLEYARFDDRLDGVVLKINGLGVGLARAQELREAVLRLKAKGKKVIAYVLSASDADYLVASAADHVYAAPWAMFLVDGLRANTLFLGGAMERLGVQWDVVRVGAFKNAPDQLTRKDMSPEQREAMGAYLDEGAKVLEAAALVSRRLPAETFRAAVDEGVKSAARSKELGLIDDVLTPAEFDAKLEVLLPGSRVRAPYQPRNGRDVRWGAMGRVAIVPVIGSIRGGSDGTDPLGLSEASGAKSFVRALAAAVSDSSVKAIVLRIDSGGGDGMASDMMYRAVLEAKKKKPVIASMGDAAASGGYYVAMGADEVFASSTTLTGSIGAFILKPAVKKLAEDLSIRQESISRGERSGIFDLYAPWTDGQRQSAQKLIEAYYDTFITEVASSRKVTKAAVDTVAQGRIWSGHAAKERGLVDSVGGLQEALAAARKRGALEDSSDVDIAVFQDSRGLFDVALARTALQDDLADTAWNTSNPSPALERLAQALEGLVESAQPSVQARLEYTVDVK